MLSIYIHIPFCIRKCSYCDFNSFEENPPLDNGYVELLLKELEIRSKTLEKTEVPTLYFGGGTPSLLAPAQISALIKAVADKFTLQKNAEITLEANPGTVTAESLDGYLAAGVNRLSIGVQSLDDRQLSLLGRIHTADDARKAFAMSRSAGFANIGIDLIHSLPGQTLEEWQSTLCQAIAMKPQHISAYGLSVEEGTPFARMKADGALSLPEEELTAEMFELTSSTLCSGGYEHYEISNFSLPGYRSRHNQIYWERKSYLGLGAGAHSFLRLPGFGCRWENPPLLKEYEAAVRSGETPAPSPLSEHDAMSEFMFLGLRRLDGVDRADFAGQFGMSLEKAFPDAVIRACKNGLLLSEGTNLKLSSKGLLLANIVMSEFV
ncbi:MAG: radical SAM family heme chaperone HemW [Geobacteraceae bacterium]|nr:radical SAM family heme chaperone HemW [Geobacteraceae bacterium]